MRGISDSGAFVPASGYMAGSAHAAIPQAEDGRRNARAVARGRRENPLKCSRLKHWAIMGGATSAALGVGYQSGAIDIAQGALSKLGAENVIALVVLVLVFQVPVLGFQFWFIERQRRSEAELNRQMNGIWQQVLSENKEVMIQVGGRLDSFGERVGSLLATLERVLVALNRRPRP